MHFKQRAAALMAAFGQKSAPPVCVLGNPRTGGVRSCSLYCGKELVLGVERVNVPGNLLWLKDGQSVQKKKSVFGSEGWVSAPLLV